LRRTVSPTNSLCRCVHSKSGYAAWL